MATLAEVLWGKNSTDIDAFTEALFKHIVYWKKEKVNIANHLLDAQASVEIAPGKGVYVTLKTPLNKTKKYSKIPATKDFTASKADKIWLEEDGIYQFYAELQGQKGRTKEIKYQRHKGNLAKVTLKNKPSPKFSGNGPQSVFNGIKGFEDRYGGSEWLGFSGDDFDATLTFHKPQNIQSLSFKFFKGEGQWIYLPTRIAVYGILDGGKRQLLVETHEVKSDDKIANITLPFSETTVSQLNIVIKNFGIMPEGSQGAGNEAFLFVDEIEIK